MIAATAEEILVAMDKMYQNPPHGLKLRDIEAFLDNSANHGAFQKFLNNPAEQPGMQARNIDMRSEAQCVAYYVHGVYLDWSGSGCW